MITIYSKQHNTNIIINETFIVSCIPKIDGTTYLKLSDNNTIDTDKSLEEMEFLLGVKQKTYHTEIKTPEYFGATPNTTEQPAGQPTGKIYPDEYPDHFPRFKNGTIVKTSALYKNYIETLNKD